MTNFINILVKILLILSICSCNNDGLSKKEYKRILDSLKRIEVPLTIDSFEIFKREQQDIDIRIPDSNGILRSEYRMIDNTFRRHIRHKDSLFECVYEYRANGLLECYYRLYYNSRRDDPVGYVIYYNEEGKVESFHDRLYLNQETGNNAKYTIYDVINKLKNNNIDLLKDYVYITYTDWTGKGDTNSRNEDYAWIVVIDHYDINEDGSKEISYYQKLRIDPNTGEVLEDWMEERE